MNPGVDRGRFRRELAGWAVRGFLCAVPSAFWAVAANFNRPPEIAAMVLGFAAWVTIFAWFSAKPMTAVIIPQAGFRRALKMAAWIKSALLVGVLAGWALVTVGRVGAIWMVWGVVPDLWFGMGSLSLVQSLAGLRGHLGMRSDFVLGQLNSFGWTLLATLVQGALIALLLAASAGLLLAGSRLWQRFGPRFRFSPVRSAD